MKQQNRRNQIEKKNRKKGTEILDSSYERRRAVEKNLFYGKVSAILAGIISVIAIICTGKGIWDSSTYGDLLSLKRLSENLYYGSVAQDISMLLISVILLFLSVYYIYRNSAKILIAIIGLVWCESYAFGLYVIQGQYTDIYYLYLAIFGLSIYGMIFGLLRFNGIQEGSVMLPKNTSRWVGGFLSTILCLMVPLWVMRMIPNILDHEPSETYGVFVMDLGIVFPAIGFIAVMLLRNKAFGKILAGVALIKTCSLCLTWGFAELYGPLLRHIPIMPEMVGTSAFFTIMSGILLVPYFRKLKIEQ